MEGPIRFEMQTPGGPIQVCEWLVGENAEINEIHLFYYATGLPQSP